MNNLNKSVHYRGRFAPSPTGPLHFGSLVAATGSYLQAKHQQGEWLVRIDDIDPPREVKGATTNILKTLEEFGFQWDGEISYQSQRHQYYNDAIDELQRKQLAYSCNCTRSSITKATGQTGSSVRYPGLCRNKNLTNANQYSIRILTTEKFIVFHDRLHGSVSTNFDQEIGDFILRRADSYFSYHLATGIDDAEQNITEVVRGADLLQCTAQQIHVQNSLNLATPGYMHLPVALNEQGEKLSKQTYAPAIDKANAVSLLFKTLKFLGQQPSSELESATIDELWQWAIANWSIKLISL